MNYGSFLEDDFIGFVVSGSHVLKEFFLLDFYQIKKLPVFLNHILCIVLEHNFLERLLLTNYL